MWAFCSLATTKEEEDLIFYLSPTIQPKPSVANSAMGEDSATTTTKDEKAKPTPEMNQRMGAVLKAEGNDVCADCPANRPLWVSFLAGRVEKERKMGILCCTKCAQYHHFELGSKRCLIKYLKMAHECKLMAVLSLLFVLQKTFVCS